MTTEKKDLIITNKETSKEKTKFFDGDYLDQKSLMNQSWNNFHPNSLPSLTSDPQIFEYYLKQNPPSSKPVFQRDKTSSYATLFSSNPDLSRFHFEHLKTLEQKPDFKKPLRPEYQAIMNRFEYKNGLYSITLKEYNELPMECRGRFGFNFIGAF